MLYLDNAATSLKKPLKVYTSMARNTIENSANSGRGGHFYSLRATKKIYDTTESLCRLFNISSPERIAYTQNATYALNMAIMGILDKYSHVIVTQMEHNSVLRPVKKTCEYTMIKADRHGRIRLCDISDAIRDNTKMIIATHASNVCGTILPIEKISKIAHDNGLLFMADAAQTAGCLPIDVRKDGIDLMAFSGHKGLMTPMGVGGLYVGENVEINPVITGGTGSLSESLVQPDFMPDMLQSGTLNAPAIIAAKESVELILKETPEAIGERERKLAVSLVENLNNMPNVIVYGLGDESDRNGTVAFNVKGMDSVAAAQLLNDKYKICTRGGWHCAYTAHQALGSHKQGAVRASFGYFNNKKDVEKLTDAVFRISKEQKKI
ncbi:MAG: aminotransferase class V-fold PLP-dependent enzyme [Clostridia bacterium]|nr:aminotransferase class V-fold PLP-dependent enzyme [Clostridia bacterium]